MNLEASRTFEISQALKILKFKQQKAGHRRPDVSFISFIPQSTFKIRADPKFILHCIH